MSSFHVYDKIQFLEYLLKQNVINNDITMNFLRELARSRTLIAKRVDFSKQALGHYKYSITINKDKKRMFIRINHRFYSDERMLNYILDGMNKNPEMRLNICVISTNDEQFDGKFNKLCHDTYLVRELITEAAVDLVLSGVQKEGILKRVEKALEEKDEKLFNELMEQYKQL